MDGGSVKLKTVAVAFVFAVIMLKEVEMKMGVGIEYKYKEHVICEVDGTEISVYMDMVDPDPDPGEDMKGVLGVNNSQTAKLFTEL